MKFRTIPPEQFSEFIIENGFKNVPELFDMIPVEQMYEILEKNIRKVYEHSGKYSTFSGTYSRTDKSICIVNREKNFDKSTLENEKDVCVHEAIHALFTKSRIKKKIKGTQKTKSNILYNKNPLKIIKEAVNFYTEQVGTSKSDLIFSIYRNIKSVLSGEVKYKYKGNIISKFFQIMESFFNRFPVKGFGLNEGFTEWLKGKVCGEPNSYKNEVEIINQIEAVLGVRETLEIGNGDFSKIGEMLGMNKTDFKEFIYRLDEDTRAGYRLNKFDLVLDMSKETLNKKEKIKFFLNKISFGFEDKEERIREITYYFSNIRDQNLSKAEELLLVNCISPKIQSFMDKKELSMSDIKQFIDINKSVREFLYYSDIKDVLFTENSNAYKNFEKHYSDLGNKALNQYQDNLSGLSLEDIRLINQLYLEMKYENQINEKNKTFIEKVNVQKSEIFQKVIFPELKKLVDSNSSIKFKQVLDFYNLYGIFIDKKMFKEYILKGKCHEEDIEKIEKLLRLDFEFGFISELDVEYGYDYDFDEFIPISEYEEIEDEFEGGDEIDSLTEMKNAETLETPKLSFKNITGRILKKKSIAANEIIDIEKTMQEERDKIEFYDKIDNSNYEHQ